MQSKGFVIESDHPYAYAMQYRKAFRDVSDWLIQHGCDADLSTLGNSGPHPIAVYGLYDKNRISYEQMLEEWNKEAERQMSIE